MSTPNFKELRETFYNDPTEKALDILATELYYGLVEGYLSFTKYSDWLYEAVNYVETLKEKERHVCQTLKEKHQ